MDNTYRGFCFDKNGYHTPGVTLNGVPGVIGYCKLNGLLQYEVRITDIKEEDTVMQVIEGIVVWPEELKGKHVSELPIPER
ncbi:MAG: hypothetical protein N2647_05550 [Thermodesulfovibrio sp.]|nr:hypothetical protein [Thermodesulfovibrio sp.]